MSEGIELARSTFNRHKDAIEDIFGIYIECNRKNGYKYSIGNPEALESDSIQNWMLAILHPTILLANVYRFKIGLCLNLYHMKAKTSN